MLKLLKKNEFLFLFLSYAVLILLFVFTNHTFLGIQDETHLQATLKGGEVINYMTSYPLAVIMTHLNAAFPLIQWYSLMMIFYTLFIAIIIVIYIVKIKFKSTILTFIFKSLLFILGLLLIIYSLFEVDVTTPSLLLIALAIPLIKNHQISFLFIFWIASFLREQIIFSILPLIIIAYVLNFNKKYFNRNKVLISLLLFAGILFNHFSYKLDSTYNDWMNFTEKRAYYTDFGGNEDKQNLLTKDEYHLSKTWWILDLDLYPAQKIVKTAGSTIDILKERLHKNSLQRYIPFILHRHPIFYTLLFLSLLIAFLSRSIVSFFGYSVFFLGLCLLLIVKDVERVTLPVTLLWWAMIFTDYIRLSKIDGSGWYKKISLYISIIILLIASYQVAETLPLDKITEYNRKEALHKELKAFIGKNHMELEITSGFPSSWERLIEAIMQNHLFDEEHWVDYNKDFLLSGWLTKVPLCYVQHHISFNGVKRKYIHFHDWMMSKNAGILGSKGEGRHIRPFLVHRLMQMYDEKFPKEGCKHVPIILDQSKHFIIHKIVYQCSKIRKEYNIDIQNKKLLWDYSLPSSHSPMLKKEENSLRITGNDPWIFTSYNKKILGKVLFDLEMESPQETILQLFYRDKNIKQPLSEKRSVSIKIKEGMNHIQLSMPGEFLTNQLRIDPTTKKGIYKIKNFSFYLMNTNK